MGSMRPNGEAPAIEVRGLRKSFGDHLVLDGIDFSVAQGEIFCLLGPNGSGKTTTVEILATLQPADEGALRVGGHDPESEPDAVRRSIGVTGQFSAVDDLLTGRENLSMMADLAHLGRAEGRDRVAEMLERFDLVEPADTMVATYSGGMKRRLDLAMTLLLEPQIIFLDEPTTGLDPRSRIATWEIVRERTAAGVTILLTTQQLEEADRLADHIAILDGGRVVTEGTPSQLKQLVAGGHLELVLPDPVAFAAAGRAIGDVEWDGDPDRLTLRIPTDGSAESLYELLGRLDHHQVSVESVAVRTADLDDVFLALTAHSDAERALVGAGPRESR